jgi:hypothetical protein
VFQTFFLSGNESLRSTAGLLPWQGQRGKTGVTGRASRGMAGSGDFGCLVSATWRRTDVESLNRAQGYLKSYPLYIKSAFLGVNCNIFMR